MKIELRKGLSDDAEFISHMVMEAMGIDSNFDPELLKVMVGICKREDTLYSYKNADIVTCNGSVAGGILSYNGGDYQEMSDRTFTYIAKEMGAKKLEPGTETGPGEYYLDSLYVSPEFRGHHISNILVQNALETAQGLGFTLASLLVDTKKTYLHKLYENLGFRMDGKITFFGVPFYRMIQDI